MGGTGGIRRDGSIMPGAVCPSIGMIRGLKIAESGLVGVVGRVHPLDWGNWLGFPSLGLHFKCV